MVVCIKRYKKEGYSMCVGKLYGGLVGVLRVPCGCFEVVGRVSERYLKGIYEDV